MTTNTQITEDRILILDFGSQYSQLIARRVREAGVYSEMYAFDMSEEDIRAFNPNGIILSGGPESVHEEGSPRAPQVVFELGVNFTFFDTGFSWLFVFCFNATLASGGFANSFMLKMVSLGEFIRGVLKSNDLSKM